MYVRTRTCSQEVLLSRGAEVEAPPGGDGEVARLEEEVEVERLAAELEEGSGSPSGKKSKNKKKKEKLQA